MVSRLAALIVIALAWFCVTAQPCAAASRPNALDLRVTALSSTQLLMHPASELVDPDRQQAAQRLVRWMLPGYLLSIIVPVFVLAYFWQSGTAARLRDALRLRTRSETLTRLCFGGALGVVFQIASAAPQFYIYRVQRVMGLSEELLRSWVLSFAISTLVALVIGSVTVAVVLWLVDRTHQWYLFTIAFILAASLGVGLVKPLLLAPFEKRIAFPPAYQQRISEVENNAMLDVPVDLASHGQYATNAAITIEGIGPTQHVVVAPDLLAAATPQEFQWVLATQLGRIANADPLHNALWSAAFIILGAALAVFVSDRIGFRRDDDAVSRLALVTAFLGIAYLVVAPVNNSLLQAQTARADLFAERVIPQRTAAVRAVVRMVDQRMDEICPSLGARLYLDRMPPPAERISSFNGSRNPCP